ncbi:MAG: hypothetical protein HOE30_08520 [Deltaproteobacteria bacterium]|nr:hypothetical protein [Deltaproteobacteria bacterium]
MAFTAAYDEPKTSFSSSAFIWRATDGGTSFTAIPYNSTDFEFFPDDAVVDDALYFSVGRYSTLVAGLRFNVGTAIAATSYTLAWEYYHRTDGWTAIEDLADDTNSFATTGQNDVRFPQQWDAYTITIEGNSSCLWVRCRLSAVDTITEGGANQTDTIKYGQGKLTISGTTDEVPATFTEIYDWLVANQPHISVGMRNDNSFDFTKVGLVINSRLFTSNEIVELGPNCSSNNTSGLNSFNYVTSGYKKDDDTGYGGSTFIIYGRPNSRVFSTSISAKFYGTTLRGGKILSDTYSYPGYVTLLGDWIDCNIELAIGFPTTGSSVNNCRVVGGLLIAGSLTGTFTKINYLCTASTFMYVYYSGFTLSDFGYSFRGSTGYVFYVYQGSGSQASFDWKFLNPGTPLNSLSDSIKPMRIGTPGTKVAWSKIYTYDDSAGTFSADLSASTVPLHGDVGDIIYFSPTSAFSSATGGSPYFEIATGTNDYVYKWEYYQSGWVEVDKEWDQTLNLSQDGTWYMNVSAGSDSTTINGHTGDWIRATIVTKGTGSPESTVNQQNRCSAVNRWNLKEKYSLDLKVVDTDGTAIEAATVTATDENGVEIFSVDTAADGTIAQQETLAKLFYFEPVANPSTLISENVYTTFDLSITKAGYGNLEISGLPLGEKIDWVMKLGAGTQTIIYDSTFYDAIIY